MKVFILTIALLQTIQAHRYGHIRAEGAVDLLEAMIEKESEQDPNEEEGESDAGTFHSLCLIIKFLGREN